MAQQRMMAKAYWAYLSLRDLRGWCPCEMFRSGSRSDAKPAMFSSQVNLVLIYQPTERDGRLSRPIGPALELKPGPVNIDSKKKKLLQNRWKGKRKDELEKSTDFCHLPPGWCLIKYVPYLPIELFLAFSPVVCLQLQGLHRNVGASRFNGPYSRQGCILARTVESNQGGRFNGNESVADSFRNDLNSIRLLTVKKSMTRCGTDVKSSLESPTQFRTCSGEAG
ncbi:hypothetical protein TNCV_4871131 [Trichonephila clavipes]|nr:hypothetical protein TNCV_4871131 [Trichonephila clavipes]